ncbi:TRAP transporter small permease subunit [Sedimenticola selenatireducens]|uniref:TRAP transporter small permease protein n=1 Tax=Sedimenticola selenatireducens TaxID=191960 RepID=A0A558DVX7_9GAMM|nr:TRAP transporter small permease [Sedimenticola selenatireducens]TVO77881.1 TRAP transporter small permease [Sedimenticola selenatireducens]TVT65186.1 MAG: TRAP transporter small permease [Sedimenticola selenatireducens]
MSSSSTVLEDGSRLSWADRTLFRFETVLTLLGGIVILLLVFLASVNVLGRWLFDLPINGYVDWVEQAMAFFAFLGIAYTQRMGGHIRMDMLVGHLKGRLLWLSEFISVLLMLGVTLVLIYGSYLHFYRAFQIGDSSLDIDLPTWPAKLVVPVALSILALRLMLQIWGYLRAVKQGDDEPIAVPLIEDAATVAAKEAEAVMGSLTEEEAK